MENYFCGGGGKTALAMEVGEGGGRIRRMKQL